MTWTWLYHNYFIINFYATKNTHYIMTVMLPFCMWGYAQKFKLILAVQSSFSPLHVRVAGSGVQVPSTVIPSDVQFALILPAGTYPGAHMKNISAPTSVLWYISIKPFRGPMGIPQLTGRKKGSDGSRKFRTQHRYLITAAYLQSNLKHQGRDSIQFQCKQTSSSSLEPDLGHSCRTPLNLLLC